MRRPGRGRGQDLTWFVSNVGAMTPRITWEEASARRYGRQLLRTPGELCVETDFCVEQTAATGQTRQQAEQQRPRRTTGELPLPLRQILHCHAITTACPALAGAGPITGNRVPA